MALDTLLTALRNATEDCFGISWGKLWGAGRDLDLVAIRSICCHELAERGRMDSTRLAKILPRDRVTIRHSLEMYPTYMQEPLYKVMAEDLQEYIKDILYNNESQNNALMITLNASGSVGRDAEVRTINGKDYTAFSIATNNRKDAPAGWVKVMYYGTKVKEFIRKGAIVEASGRPEFSVYQDKPECTLWADRCEILKFAPQAQQPQAEDDGKDDLPWA